jgi:hypothetical protein
VSVHRPMTASFPPSERAANEAGRIGQRASTKHAGRSCNCWHLRPTSTGPGTALADASGLGDGEHCVRIAGRKTICREDDADIRQVLTRRQALQVPTWRKYARTMSWCSSAGCRLWPARPSHETPPWLTSRLTPGAGRGPSARDGCCPLRRAAGGRMTDIATGR